MKKVVLITPEGDCTVLGTKEIKEEFLSAIVGGAITLARTTRTSEGLCMVYKGDLDVMNQPVNPTASYLGESDKTKWLIRGNVIVVGYFELESGPQFSGMTGSQINQIQMLSEKVNTSFSRIKAGVQYA